MSTQTIVVRNRDEAQEAINAIKKWYKPDCSFLVDIKPYKMTRSLAQNRLYWKWLGEISQHYFEASGDRYQPDTFHEYFKRGLLGADTVFIKNSAMTVPRSTASLKVGEFSDYLNQIEAECATEWGLQLSHPEDLYYMALMRDAGVQRGMMDNAVKPDAPCAEDLEVPF